MKNVLNADRIRAAERAAENAGLDEKLLRVNAALAVADGIVDRVKNKLSETAVFCGVGGNGYDGLLAACRLHRLGGNVTAYLVGEADKFDRSVMAYTKAEKLTVLPASEYNGTANIIIDAIFGIGLNRPITGEIATLINSLNSAENAFRLAIDIPSGLNADSGEIMGVAFRAHATLSFSCYKLGMLFGAGRDVCGRIVVDDIGVTTSSNIKVFDGEDIAPFVRNATAHKGTAGRVFIIGGCGTMIGAPLMAGAAAHAAYLNGAGTVTVCLPSVHRAAASARSTMAMMKFMPDDANGFIKFDKNALDEIIGKAAALDIGIGMGATPDLKRILRYICDNFDGALVIDADALNAIKGDYGFLRDAKCK
ncbi:MAG: NAD(P)H-hydrate epimerase, partial [Clostridiales bacterium]|nr:NAD(P)H-hydrate epimerase [Clostridiales bacterium]